VAAEDCIYIIALRWMERAFSVRKSASRGAAEPRREQPGFPDAPGMALTPPPR
jgi:hypothetical protein